MELLKPGIKTSELGLYAIVEVAAMIAIFMPESHWAVQVAGMVVAGLGAIGYGHQRHTLKREEMQAVQSVEFVEIELDEDDDDDGGDMDIIPTDGTGGGLAKDRITDNTPVILYDKDN